MLVAPLTLARNAIIVTVHLVFGQCWMKKVASSQEVICGHMVRPSQLKAEDVSSAVSVGDGDEYAALRPAASVWTGALPGLNLPYPIQARLAMTIRTKIFFTYAYSSRCKV